MFKEKERMVKKSKEKLDKRDVGLIDDALFTIRHLVGLEDHIEIYIGKISDSAEREKFSKKLNEIKELRSLLMQEVVSEDAVGTEWCMTKHSSAASMGLIELGTRFLQMDKKKEAMRCFDECAGLTNWIFEINKIPKFQEEAMTDA